MSENKAAENKKSIFASPYYVMVVLALGVIMMMLDSYIFSPALASIVNDFHTTYDMVAWVATIYMLISAVVMPLAGKLSDIFGRRNLFIIGVLFFTIGSILSSMSWDIYSLIFFRGIQAIGGGMILPAALAAMGSAAPPDMRGKTIGTLMSMSAVAMIVGPNICGFFIQHFGWRSVFYINLPIGILTILMALMFKESYGNSQRRIDIAGAAMLGVSLGALVLGLTRLESLPLTDITVFPLIAIAVLLGVLFYWYERRTPEPIVDMKVLLKGDVLSLNLAIMMLFFGMTCASLFIPTFAQTVLGMSIQDSGSIMTPRSITMFISGIVGGILLDKFGHKIMMLIGGLITIAVMLAMAYLVNDPISLSIVLVVMGLVFGYIGAAFSVALMAVTPGTEQGATMGIMGTFRSIGGMIAPVIGGYFLNEALLHTATYGQAFTDIYIAATAAVTITFLLMAYYVIRARKAAIPATPPAVHQ